MKRALLRNHRETIGAYIFDGTSMFTSTNFQKVLIIFYSNNNNIFFIKSRRNIVQSNLIIGFQLLELVSNRQDGVAVTIRISRTRELDPNADAEYIQFYNVLMRKCLRLLNLQLVGRNYFDAAAKARKIN